MSEIGLSVDNVLTAIDHGPFVGRVTKMGRLMEIYARMQGGETRIASLKGESGIGKTRVASEFLDWAIVQGADVLQGRAFEDGGRGPYQPLVEMLEQRRADEMRALQEQNTLLGPFHEILDRVLAEMHTYMFYHTSMEGQGKTEHKRLFESFTLFGQALAERTPTVMFIDDIHWSDFATLDMLQYAGRRWIESNTPILLLLSLRTEALVMLPPFAKWLAYLEHDLHAASFILNPLALEDTINFVFALAPEKTAYLEGFGHWLHAETGGQAFYMVELLKMLFEQGLLAPYEHKDGHLGIDFTSLAGNASALEHMLLPGVRAVIALRIKQLTPIAREMVVAGAIIGRKFPFECLCSTANLDEENGWKGLNELLAQHILFEEGGYYLFIHDKVREVVYMDVAGSKRIELHARALETPYIEAMPLSFLAYHVRGAGLYKRAFYLYVTIGDGMQRLLALRDAVAFYESALHLLVEQQEQGGGIFSEVSATSIEHLYLQLGYLYEHLNERERAWATYQSMFLLARRLNIITLISVALSQLAAVTLHKTFTIQEQARMLFQEESDNFGSVAVLAENEWQLTQFNFYRFDAEKALQHGKQALRLAEKADIPELIAQALSGYASAQMLVSSWEEAEAMAEQARMFYERQHNSVMEAICLAQIAQAKFSRSQPQEGVIAARGAYLAFMQAKYSWGRIFIIHHMVAGLLDIGAYGEALTLAQEALELARSYNVSLLLCLCLTALGRVQRALMNLSSAYQFHREALTVFSADVPLPVIEMLAAELCADCALADEWAEAQVYATQALEQRNNSTFLYVGLTRWYETEILVRTGYNERATADAELFGKAIGQSHRYKVPYLRTQAVLALWRGEFELTHLYLQEASELAEEAGLPGELWSIEAARGELYLAQGDKDGAYAAFEHAREIVYALALRIEEGQGRAKFLSAQKVQKVIANVRE